MVLVSHKYKFIYLKNRKVAGTSVESFFGKYCIDPSKDYSYQNSISENIDDYGIIGFRGLPKENADEKWKNHINAKLIKKYLGIDKFDKYYKFCVVRNPYDKMVSRYFWKKSKISFKEFAKTTNVSNLDIHCIDGQSVCNYFIRYENIEEDIIKLCKLLKIDDYDISLLPYHKSNYRKTDKGYQEYYDEETRKIVYENHKEEFEMFDYTF